MPGKIRRPVIESEALDGRMIVCAREKLPEAREGREVGRVGWVERMGVGRMRMKGLVREEGVEQRYKERV